MTNPVTFRQWAESDNSYPTLDTLYNWTRPGERRDRMIAAGVIRRINGRWLFNPVRWRQYCETDC